MNQFTSNFAPLMEEMLVYKESLGYARATYESRLHDFDRFCLTHFPEESLLKKEMVLKWMENGRMRVHEILKSEAKSSEA